MCGTALLIFALAFLIRSVPPQSTTAATGTESTLLAGNIEKPLAESSTPAPYEYGLPLEALGKTTIPMAGSWLESDPLADDSDSWTGSTCVFFRDEKLILLFTNRHCLGLDDLAAADSDDLGDRIPEVAGYQMAVTFGNGKTKPVDRFVLFEGDVDLALLAINPEGLEEGTDYVILKDDPDIVPREGMEVAVVGSPHQLQGTHTFGRVSALRKEIDSKGGSWDILQTDAAINPGNSGGPLFLKINDSWTWVGVVRSKRPGDNLGFAIRFKPAAGKSKFSPPFDANKEGAVKAIDWIAKQ